MQIFLLPTKYIKKNIDFLFDNNYFLGAPNFALSQYRLWIEGYFTDKN